MKKLLLLAVMSLGLFSCNDDEPQTFGPNQTIVGFAEESVSNSFLTDVNDAPLNVPISLIGFANETLPGDVVVNWEVDASSTAVAGVEYTISGSQSAVISAGNTTGTANFEVYPTTFNPSAPKTIVINLTTVPSNNAIVGEQYKQVVVTLQGVCNSQLQGNYTNSTLRLNNATTYTWTDEVFEKVDGTASDYVGNHVGQYYGTAQTAATVTGTGSASAPLAVPTALFFFTDICDKLQVNQHNMADAYSNIVTQDATQFANSFVDPDTGIVTIEYSIWFTNNTIERKFKGTYVPQ